MRRSICAAAISVMAFLAITGLADAAVRVLNPGVFTATSSNSVFALPSIGLTLTCSSSVIRDTVTATGAGTIPVGNALQTGCSSAFLGSYTVTQMSAWTSSTTQTPAGVTISFTIPTNGVRATSTITGQSIALGGTITTGLIAITRGVLTSVSSVTFTNASGLIVTSSNEAGRPVGLAAMYSGSYTIGASVQFLLS